MPRCVQRSRCVHLIWISFIILFLSSKLFAGSGGFSMYPTTFILNKSNGEFAGKTSINYNAGTEPCPIEISIYERSVNELGEQTHSEVPTNDFVAFPGQMVLMPGERQIVQLQWVGKKLPEVERQYTVVAEQVPIKGLPNEQIKFKPMGSVKAVVKYEGILLFTADEFKPRIVINEFKKIVIAKKIGLQIQLYNEGTAMQKVDNLVFRVTRNNNSTVIIKPKYLTNTHQGNSLFAREKRTVFIKWEHKFPATEIKTIEPVFDLIN